jgi:RNA polymerase sigma-70 factor (ECF subfamily)
MARVTPAEAVEDVYRQDGARLWRAVFAFSGNEDVASDAVAEAFAQALRRGTAVRDVRAWVWRSAFRLAAGDLKRQSSLSRQPMPDPGAADPQVDDELFDALQGLTPPQRIAIVLHYYVDCPVSEIARRTGMNPLVVRAHLSRGRKRMRLLLGEDR